MALQGIKNHAVIALKGIEIIEWSIASSVSYRNVIVRSR